MKAVKRGLIARIALLVVGVEVAAFATLGWFYSHQFSNAMAERTYARLHLVGQLLADDELGISALSRKSLLTDMVGAPYLRGMAVGGSGLVIVSSDSSYLGRPATEVPGFDSAWFADAAPDEQLIEDADSVTAIRHIHGTQGGPPIYYTVLTFSTAELNVMQRAIATAGMLGSLLFILLTSAGIIFIAQRLINRRVQTSLGVLKQVEGGDLTVRIPITYNDELGQIQQGINSMTETVGALLTQQRHGTEELRKQKDLLNSIIQHAPIRVFWKDRDSRFVGCNTQFARDAGLNRPEELIGKNDFDMPWHEQAERYRADDRAVLESGMPKLDFEEPQTREDGSNIWLRTSKVPLRDPDDRIIGVLGIYADITAQKQAAEQIRYLAYFDALTSLPNRRLLLDRLQQTMVGSIRNQQYGALLILDLDNFKDLNDSQGHDVGDQLLIEVGKRLRQNTRQEDTVARLGGDEYVVIAEALGTDEGAAAIQAKVIAEQVRNALLQPYLLKEGELRHYSTSSIGVTLFQGEAYTAETLLKHADVALYQAKNAGRNTVRFYNTAMQSRIDERASMIAGLRTSLERGELQLYYQPQVDAAGRLVGVEALLRWLPTDAPPVSPAIFVPLAEETGLILPIGAWVIEQACIQLRKWAASEETSGLTLAINVSAVQFRQQNFAEQVAQQLNQYGLDPSRLKLELTESVVLSHVDEVVAQMHKLKQLGVSFSLDDFGTGFSSLSYLKRLPLDQIKIDQSFIRDILHDPNDAAIVRAILAISQSLGFNVIAEGVELEEQRAFLIRHGCEYFQGYLFGRPLPISEWPQALWADATA